MQCTGAITDMGMEPKTRQAKISLVLNTDDLAVIEQLKNENKLSIELKKWRKKRSLDANAYCWKLCDLIAKELTIGEAVVTKELIYKAAIQHIGTFQAMIWEEKYHDKCVEIWEKQGLGFLVKEVSRKDKCVKVHCYYGSSTYDSKEMSLLIEYLIQLAKDLEIETKPKAEIDSLLRNWK